MRNQENTIVYPTARNWLNVLLLATIAHQADAVHACDLRVFGKLDPCRLDEVRGAAADDRVARLAALGLTRDDWLPRFIQSADRYARTQAHVRKQDRKMIVQITFGTALAELTREGDAVPALKRLVEAPGVSESVVYSALLALDTLQTPDEWMLSQMNHPNAEIARLAVLAVGTGDEPAVQKQLDTLRAQRGGESAISAALQFIDMYRHDVAGYTELTDVSDKLNYVETRLRRAFNPVNGITQTWDPHTAGHPVSRWALKVWRALGQSHPQEVATYVEHIRNAQMKPVATAYRYFLLQSAGLTASSQ